MVPRRRLRPPLCCFWRSCPAFCNIFLRRCLCFHHVDALLWNNVHQLTRLLRNHRGNIAFFKWMLCKNERLQMWNYSRLLSAFQRMCKDDSCGYFTATSSGQLTQQTQQLSGVYPRPQTYLSFICSHYCHRRSNFLYQPVQSVSRLCHRWVQRSQDSSSSCARHIISVFRNTPAADRSPPVQKPTRPEVSLFR